MKKVRVGDSVRILESSGEYQEWKIVPVSVRYENEYSFERKGFKYDGDRNVGSAWDKSDDPRARTYSSNRIISKEIRTSEASPENGTISEDSPLARALLGKSENDEYRFSHNSRVFSGKVISIRVEEEQ
jgi:hypothetical protein